MRHSGTLVRMLFAVLAAALVGTMSLALAQDDGWTNDESIRGGLHLLAQYDSSGPDAWDVAAHPLVYFTSESHQTNNPELPRGSSFAGFHIVDAYTKEVIAWRHFSATPEADVRRGPHGVGVSPDGQWVYVGWGEMIDGRQTGVMAVVNARTLKLELMLKQDSYYQGAMRTQYPHHIQCWTDDDGNDRCILQWGFGADGGPHHIIDPNDNHRVVKTINYDDVHPIGHPFTTPSPDGKFVYVSMTTPEIRSAHYWGAGIAKFNIATGVPTVIWGTGHHIIGITHTMDGRFTYAIDGHGSYVIKIDNETNSIVGETSAGVAGPYGIALNWDESLIFTIGKGEGTHNRGGVVGVLTTTPFGPLRTIMQPITLGGSAQSIDHAILHPDPEVNEMWISNMAGWETIVLDLNTFATKAYIPTPNGGDTHSGAFVQYAADWTGELMSDMGGPKSKTMQETIRSNAAAR
jgi:DNA-binding beta-propeller fold protein YncE